MPVQSALLFIGELREGGELARAVEALAPNPDLARLVELAAAAGFAFTEAEIRAAFARDWSMRAFRYARKQA